MDYSEVITEMNKNIWFELTYLRFIIIKILEKNPDLAANFTPETAMEAKNMAQQVMLEKYAEFARKYPPKKETK